MVPLIRVGQFHPGIFARFLAGGDTNSAWRAHCRAVVRTNFTKYNQTVIEGLLLFAPTLLIDW